MQSLLAQELGESDVVNRRTGRNDRISHATRVGTLSELFELAVLNERRRGELLFRVVWVSHGFS